MTYPDYIDTATGKTLACVPGNTYNVIPASGNIRSAGTTMPGDGRFTTGSGRETALDEELPEKEEEDLPDEAGER
jgi:hypothetical protein